MEDRLQKLSDKAKALPKAPGVYLMKDSAGRGHLRGQERFSARPCRVVLSTEHQARGEEKAPLREVVVDFEIIETDSESKPCWPRMRLIKDIQPRFNAKLIDDKTFPYLMVSTDEEFPGVYVTREPRKGAKLYGPFTSVYQLKEAVTHLQKAFKFRTCHLEISESDTKRRFFRPCLLYAIKQCNRTVRRQDRPAIVC